MPVLDEGIQQESGLITALEMFLQAKIAGRTKAINSARKKQLNVILNTALAERAAYRGVLKKLRELKDI